MGGRSKARLKGKSPCPYVWEAYCKEPALSELWGRFPFPPSVLAKNPIFQVAGFRGGIFVRSKTTYL